MPVKIVNFKARRKHGFLVVFAIMFPEAALQDVGSIPGDRFFFKFSRRFNLRRNFLINRKGTNTYICIQKNTKKVLKNACEKCMHFAKGFGNSVCSYVFFSPWMY